MAITQELTDEQLDRRVMGILRRELNLSEFARYLRLHRQGSGDYTRDRHKWLGGITMEEIEKELGLSPHK